MPKRFFALAALLLTLLLGACSGDPGAGPKEVKWDRDACERCRMVLSDRHYSAQVRVYPEGKRSKVFFFDDIGCAILWLEEQPWKADPKTEIWVTEHHSGKWIDARSATYVKEKITPMEYGLGAQTEPAPDGIGFAEARRHVIEVEERFTIRGVQLLDRLKEQAERRAAAQKDSAQSAQ
jgi:nitrous oxide reductase accessory protein NosL